MVIALESAKESGLSGAVFQVQHEPILLHFITVCFKSLGDQLSDIDFFKMLVLDSAAQVGKIEQIIDEPRHSVAFVMNNPVVIQLLVLAPYPSGHKHFAEHTNQGQGGFSS